MTTFAQYVARGDSHYIAYARISGIGKVFSNADKPSAWTLPTGYMWSRTLEFFRPLEGGQQGAIVASQDIDPVGGASVSGSAVVEFKYDAEAANAGAASEWVDLIAPSGATRETWRHDSTIIDSPSDENITVMDSTGISAGEILYAGLETIQVGAVAGNTLTGCTRGLFGSRPQWLGDLGGLESRITSAKRLTSWPEDWKGRIIEVWLAPAEAVNGTFVPVSSAVDGAPCKQIFRGPIQGREKPSEPGSIRFMALSLIQATNAPIISRPRKYSLGPGVDSYGWTYIEQLGPRYVAASVAQSGVFADFGYTGTSVGVVDLHAELGAGLVDLQILMNTALDKLGDLFDDGTDRFWWNWAVVPGDDGLPRVQIEMMFFNGGVPTDIDGEVVIKLSAYDGPGLLGQDALRAIGADEDIVFGNQNSEGEGTGTYVWTCPNPIPRYYVARGNTRIYYQPNLSIANLRTHDPPELQGTPNERPESPIDRPHFRLGKQEIVELRVRTTAIGRPLISEVFLGRTRYYGEVLRRGVLTTGGLTITRSLRATGPAFASGVIVELQKEQEEEAQLHLGLCFDAHPLFDVLRYLAISNGDSESGGLGFNVLPEGYGLGMDADWFDHGAFHDMQDWTQARADKLWIEGTTKLRDLFDQVGQAYGVIFYPKLNSDGQYLLSCALDEPPIAPGTAADTVDTSWTMSAEEAPAEDDAEHEVHNVVKLSWDRDPIEDKFLQDKQIIRDPDSVARYGAQSLEVELPWLGGGREAVDTLVQIGGSILFRLAHPPFKYLVPVCTEKAWALEPNDLIDFTYPFLINRELGGVGHSAARMRLRSKEDQFGAVTMASRLTLEHHTYAPAYPYVPCLRLYELVSGSEYKVRENINDGGFSGIGDRDILHYANAATGSWKVTATNPGESSASNDRTVTAVDTTAGAATITLNTALTTVTLPCVVSFDSFNAASFAAEQKLFAFVADETTEKNIDASAVERQAARWL